MIKENKIFIGVLVGIGVIGFALIAWASTDLNFDNGFNLNGQHYTAKTQVVDGNCADTPLLAEGDDVVRRVHKTITEDGDKFCYQNALVRDGDTPDLTPTPTPIDLLEVCPLDEYNVIDATGDNSGTIRGTRGNDAIIAGSGVKVYGRGGDDCIVVGVGSKVYGNSGDDYIITGSGSKVRGGTGQDTCFAGVGSNVKCEVYGE